MSKPGVRLRSLASRVFRPDTMEYVIGPALTDLQIECSAVAARPVRIRAWVLVRSYLAFWRIFLLCLCLPANLEAREDTVNREAPSRLLTSALLTVLTVAAVLVLPPLATIGSTAQLRAAFGGSLVGAVVLLIPQAMPIAIPAGILFGALFGVRPCGASVSVRRTILAFGVWGSVMSAVLLGWAVPTANQAFRTIVYMHETGRTPAKGVRELSWRELREQLAQRSALEQSPHSRQLQLAYQGRIALVATPLIFATLALVLVTLPRRFMSSLLGLLLFVGYYTLIGFDRLIDQGTLSPLVVAWTPNLMVFLVILLLAFRQSVSALLGPA